VKIHADKTQPDSPHALNVSDVRRILSAVPPDWIDGISTVRLTNSLAQSPYAFFSRHDGCLTIFSRHCSAKEALSAVLLELAAHSLGIDRKFGIAQSKAQMRRLLPIIQPYLDELLPIGVPQTKQFGVPPPPPISADYLNRRYSFCVCGI